MRYVGFSRTVYNHGKILQKIEGDGYDEITKKGDCNA